MLEGWWTYPELEHLSIDDVDIQNIAATLWHNAQPRRKIRE